jgi:hypothetical protein
MLAGPPTPSMLGAGDSDTTARMGSNVHDESSAFTPREKPRR